jgi:hypothetical protein
MLRHQPLEETLHRGKNHRYLGLNAVGYSWSCRHILLRLVNPNVEGSAFGSGPSVYKFALVATTWHKIVLVTAVVGLYTCLRFAKDEAPSSNDTASITNVKLEYRSHSKSYLRPILLHV